MDQVVGRQRQAEGGVDARAISSLDLGEAGLDFALTTAATLGIAYGGQFGTDMTDRSVKANLNVRF